MKKLTQQEAEERVEKRCQEMGYTLLEPFIYITSQKTMLKIKCNIDNHIWTPTYDEFTRSNCPKCGGSLKKTQDEIEKLVLEKCKENEYKLTEPFIYNGRDNTKIKLLCNKHNYDWEIGLKNIKTTTCKECLKLKNKNKPLMKSTDDFVIKLQELFGDEYDLTNVIYNGNNTPIEMKCSIHGEFYKKPRHILENKTGCKKCVKENTDNNQRKSYDKLICDFNNTHNYFYNYDKVVYLNTYTPVIITCPRHGDFPQIPRDHIMGGGCPTCNNSKGELKIEQLLKDNNIIYKTQKTFKKCEDVKTLKFDFYLPELNICIEFDGIQHFKIIERWGGEDGLIDRQKKDKIKTDFCLNNNIKLIRIRYDDNIEEKLKENNII